MTYEAALVALADPTRRRVFDELRAGPKLVGVIAAKLPVSRPAVSQHLKVLREARLVSERPDGTRRVYFIDAHGLVELRAWLDRLWDQSLAAFQAEVEREGASKGRERKSTGPARSPPSERALMLRPRLIVQFRSSPRECRNGASRATASTRNRPSRTL